MGRGAHSSAHDPAQFETQVGALLRAVHSSPVLSGFCYTQLTDTGQETNGLLRADLREGSLSRASAGR